LQITATNDIIVRGDNVVAVKSSLVIHEHHGLWCLFLYLKKVTKFNLYLEKMRLSNVKVEQITSSWIVINDFWEILSTSELNKIITKFFPKISIKNDKLFWEYGEKAFSVFVKNISYLWIPHPIFKKRIQIPWSFKDFYRDNIHNDIDTILIWVYKYNDTLLFCDFDISTYINNDLNNSSAHVHTIDLEKWLINGFFQKEDFRWNKITVFTPSRIEDYLKYKFWHKEIKSDIEIINTFDDFFYNISKKWYWIDCYKEMINANDNNKFQAERPWFYLEFLMKNYIQNNQLEDIMQFKQNKKIWDIDLDLFFPKLKSYWDLKTHWDNSNAILWNDLDTVKDLIRNESIYYIICNHSAHMDKNYNFEVTIFWNKQQNKSDILSYAEKMKHDISIKSYYILEINNFNFQYVEIFNQWHNSNWNKRNWKIMISNKCINNFLIHTATFDNNWKIPF